MALAAAGGSGLVGAVATDAWAMAKRGFTRMLGRGDEAREEVVGQQLERTRAELAAAGPRVEQVRLTQQAVWTARLEDLLTDQPEAAEQLRVLISQVAEATGPRSAGHVVQHAIAHDQAQQVVQGHGQQTNVFGAAPGSKA